MEGVFDRSITSLERPRVGGPLCPRVAEWIARVYRAGPRYRVVVEGLLDFDTDQIAGIEEQTALEIVEHLRSFFPKRGPPREDPTAEVVFLFDLAVELSSAER